DGGDAVRVSDGHDRIRCRYGQNDFDWLRVGHETDGLSSFGEAFGQYTDLIFTRFERQRKFAILVGDGGRRGKSVTGSPDVRSWNTCVIRVDDATSKNRLLNWCLCECGRD